MKNATTTRFVVRESRNVEELEALLRVRYQAFRESELAYYVPENEAGMDVDEWDKQAYHFGLWKENDFEGTAIGYLRIIGLYKTNSAEMVQTIGKKYPFLSSRIERKTRSPIRFLEMYAEFQQANDWFKKVEKDGGGLVEASRLSVPQRFQKYNAGQILIETALSVFLNGDRVSFGAMEVMDHHLPLYRNYGFRDIASKFHPEVQRTSYLVVGHYTHLPEKFRERFATMQDTWCLMGCICFDAEQPKKLLTITT